MLCCSSTSVLVSGHEKARVRDSMTRREFNQQARRRRDYFSVSALTLNCCWFCAGMRSALAAKNKNQRLGPPKNSGLKIKFTVPQPGGPGAGIKKPQIQSGQKRRPISAWEVPWTKEEEDVLKEAIDRFQQVSGNIPIKTWHLHASILNSSIASRGRNRMGKHLKEYWEGRLQPDAQRPPPQYPERIQLSDPTRDHNIAAIIKAGSQFPPQRGGLTLGYTGHTKSGGGQKNRDSIPVSQTHESHRTTMMQTLQQLGVQSTSQLPPSELIRRKAELQQRQASQVRQHPGQAGRGHPGVGAQQRMAHAGQVRQGVPASAGGQKMPAGSPAGARAPGQIAPAARAPGQMAPGPVAGRGMPPQQMAAGRGMPQGAARGQIPPQQMQHQRQMPPQQQQMYRGPAPGQPGHPHPGHPGHAHDPAAAGYVQSPQSAAGRGGYVAPGMPPGATHPGIAGQPPPGTMPMQHPGMAHHPSQQAMMQAQQQKAQAQQQQQAQAQQQQAQAQQHQAQAQAQAAAQQAAAQQAAQAAAQQAAAQQAAAQQAAAGRQRAAAQQKKASGNSPGGQAPPKR